MELNTVKYSSHRRAIINGLLYDTEKSEEIMRYTDDDCILHAIFETPNGAMFQARVEQCHVIDNYLNIISDSAYTHIQPLSELEYRDILGRYKIDKYIELFGEAQEA